MNHHPSLSLFQHQLNLGTVIVYKLALAIRGEGLISLHTVNKLTNAYILPVSEMAVLLYVVVFSLTCLLGLTVGAELESCHGAGLKYLNGDALSGMAPCLGPDNTPYPT